MKKTVAKQISVLFVIYRIGRKRLSGDLMKTYRDNLDDFVEWKELEWGA